MISLIFINNLLSTSFGETGLGTNPLPFPACGNGICETGENAINCPSDCDPSVGIPSIKEVRKMIDEKISEVRNEINNIKSEISSVKNETNLRINITNELIEKRFDEIEKRISKIEELLKNTVKQLEFPKEVKVKIEERELACYLLYENKGFVLNCFRAKQLKTEEVNNSSINISENNTKETPQSNLFKTNELKSFFDPFSFVKRLLSSLFK
jgi:hypothetical protein